MACNALCEATLQCLGTCSDTGRWGCRDHSAFYLMRRRARGVPPAARVPIRKAGTTPGTVAAVGTVGNGGLGRCLWCLPLQVSVLSSLARASLWWQPCHNLCPGLSSARAAWSVHQLSPEHGRGDGLVVPTLYLKQSQAWTRHAPIAGLCTAILSRGPLCLHHQCCAALTCPTLNWFGLGASAPQPSLLIEISSHDIPFRCAGL